MSEIVNQISALYVSALQKANKGVVWTTFAEQLTVIDKKLGTNFKQRVEKANFERDLANIPKK